MSESLAEAKSALRRHCRALRAALDEETRARASLSICGRLEQWPLFRQSHTILTYMPMKLEADLTPLLTRHPQKRWVLPRILPEEDHRMVFHVYDAKRLVRHPFGMAEPAADLPTVPPETIELALVPGLAFDHQGWRLGYGGGYFDRFLQTFKGESVGVVYRALLFEELPHGPLDVPMRWIVTEADLFSTQAV